MGYSDHPRNADSDRVLSHNQHNELRCYQQREFSTHWRKVWQKCDGAVVWSTFFAHLCMISMAPLESKKVHQKETILNCWTKLAVKIVVCLICACWLANHDITKLKSQQHISSSWWWSSSRILPGCVFVFWCCVHYVYTPVTKKVTYGYAGQKCIEGSALGSKHHLSWNFAFSWVFHLGAMWWNEWWFKSDSSFQMNVICLIWLQLMFLVISNIHLFWSFCLESTGFPWRNCVNGWSCLVIGSLEPWKCNHHFMTVTPRTLNVQLPLHESNTQNPECPITTSWK